MDVLLDIGVLTNAGYENWRRGRVSFLEKVCQANLRQLSEIMHEIRAYAAKNNLKRSGVSQEAYIRHLVKGIVPAEPPPKQVRLIGKLNATRKITGLRALYFSYLYKMGVLPRKRERNPASVYFLFREDIRFIQNIAKETRLLVRHGIDTAEQLAAHKDGRTHQIISLSSTRKHLRYRARSIKDEDKQAVLKAEIAVLSDRIGELRKEVRLAM